MWLRQYLNLLAPNSRGFFNVVSTVERWVKYDFFLSVEPMKLLPLKSWVLLQVGKIHRSEFIQWLIFVYLIYVAKLSTVISCFLLLLLLIQPQYSLFYVHQKTLTEVTGVRKVSISLSVLRCFELKTSIIKILMKKQLILL